MSQGEKPDCERDYSPRPYPCCPLSDFIWPLTLCGLADLSVSCHTMSCQLLGFLFLSWRKSDLKVPFDARFTLLTLPSSDVALDPVVTRVRPVEVLATVQRPFHRLQNLFIRSASKT